MTPAIALAVVLFAILALIGAEMLAKRANARKEHDRLVKEMQRITATRMDMGGGRLRKNPTY